ncbi:membrane protein [Sulfurifustis variabilis]|uniref:Membrane protein n=1 Tax=Sulfurifustis variabilis TaxID=1675686 RepID=A0A1B4V371_9GAMM|nr:hypothetical protein [Sulfurifustis variabilis]BAU47998.1 membrane protein [Sulfurifustis variabilis]
MEAPEAPNSVTPAGVPPERPLITIANVVYGLQAVGLLLPITFIAGIIINYVKRDDARTTLVESHFRWQIRTFWYGLLWGALGGLTAVIGIGAVILFAAYVWVMYRIIRGWLNLVDRKPMYLKASDK